MDYTLQMPHVTGKMMTNRWILGCLVFRQTTQMADQILEMIDCVGVTFAPRPRFQQGQRRGEAAMPRFLSNFVMINKTPSTFSRKSPKLRNFFMILAMDSFILLDFLCVFSIFSPSFPQVFPIFGVDSCGATPKANCILWDRRRWERQDVEDVEDDSCDALAVELKPYEARGFQDFWWKT